MAGITLAQAQAKLALWMAADDAVAGNQSYEINGRSMTRADAGEIADRITYWDAKVKELTPGAGGFRVYAGVPTDA